MYSTVYIHWWHYPCRRYQALSLSLWDQDQWSCMPYLIYLQVYPRRFCFWCSLSCQHVEVCSIHWFMLGSLRWLSLSRATGIVNLSESHFCSRLSYSLIWVVLFEIHKSYCWWRMWGLCSSSGHDIGVKQVGFLIWLDLRCLLPYSLCCISVSSLFVWFLFPWHSFSGLACLAFPFPNSLSGVVPIGYTWAYTFHSVLVANPRFCDPARLSLVHPLLFSIEWKSRMEGWLNRHLLVVNSRWCSHNTAPSTSLPWWPSHHPPTWGRSSTQPDCCSNSYGIYLSQHSNELQLSSRWPRDQSS